MAQGFTPQDWLGAIYVAYWGRAGDPGGLDYWVNMWGEKYQEGRTKDASWFASNFALQPEAADAYPYFEAFQKGQDITPDMREEFIDSIYQNLFNRAPEAEGQDYWLGQLETGTVDPGEFIATIVHSALEAAGEDAATISAKKDVAAFISDKTRELEYDQAVEIARGSEFREIIAAAAPGNIAGLKEDVDRLMPVPDPEPIEGLFPTDYEQYMITLINRARLDPEAEADIYGIDLNHGISSQDEISPDMKQPLAFNPDLTLASRGHSQWMLDNDIFHHTGSGNSSPGDRIEDTDYNTQPPWGWGENIIWMGQAQQLNDYTRFISEQHENLFYSPGHRTNTMNETFMEIGVGAMLGDYKGNFGPMTTIKFAYTSETPFVTGTVFQDLDGTGAYKPGEGMGGVQIQADGQSTVTWSSGGYAMQLEPGDYLLTFSHEEFEERVELDFTMPDKNILVDLVLSPDELEPQNSFHYQSAHSGVYNIDSEGEDVLPLGVAEHIQDDPVV